MAQLNSNNRLLQSLLLTIAITTFMTVFLFLVRSGQANGTLSLIKFPKYGQSQCSPPAETSSAIATIPSANDGSMGTISPPSATPIPVPVPVIASILPPKKGNPDHISKTPAYLKAIFDPSDETFQRLGCPLNPSTSNRYSYLQTPPSDSAKRKYFFALDLYQIAKTLPQLMGSVFQVIDFLGPHNCVLSIVEGRSTDGTYEILRALAPHLSDLGVPYFLQTSDLSPQRANPERIVLLAELRNLALRDLYENPQNYADDTTIIFSNDIYVCSEDILEIVHQQQFQGAHMTCGMDWANSSDPDLPRLYDTWIARSMTGDTFYKDMFDWDKGFFFDHPLSRDRWYKYLPVQVFSCYNGIIALVAKPFMEGTLRWRGIEGGDREHIDEECYQGEPNLLTKDLWYLGYTRIQTLPTISVAYEYWDAHNTRRVRGSVSSHVHASNGTHYGTAEEKIQWQAEPPKQFRCIPMGRGAEWVPWDQGLKALYGERKHSINMANRETAKVA